MTNSKTAFIAAIFLASLASLTYAQQISSASSYNPTKCESTIIKSGVLDSKDPIYSYPNNFDQYHSCTPGAQSSNYDIYEFKLQGESHVRASTCPSDGGSADFSSVITIYQDPCGKRLDTFDFGCTNAIATTVFTVLCPESGGLAITHTNLQPGYFYVVISNFVAGYFGAYNLVVKNEFACGGPQCITPTNRMIFKS